MTDEQIEQRVLDEGFSFTDNPRDAIYVLRNGKLIDGDIHERVRGEDYRMIECLFDDIDRHTPNFWSLVHEQTGVVQLVPETKTALKMEGQVLTEPQQKVIDSCDYRLKDAFPLLYEKSNIFFDRYIIRGVSRMYGMESTGQKDIAIVPCYNEVKEYGKQEYKWDGTYLIEYDGVTELRCTIQYGDEHLKIDFLQGDSIHGTGSPYPLDKEADHDVIEGILSQVRENPKFVDFCYQQSKGIEEKTQQDDLEEELEMDI